MKAPDEKLTRVLAEWRVEPRAEAGFRAEVWARIGGARRAAAFSGFVRAHAAPCAALLVVALGVGAWTGRERARAGVAAERAAIVSSYVSGLDARTMRMR